MKTRSQVQGFLPKIDIFMYYFTRKMDKNPVFMRLWLLFSNPYLSRTEPCSLPLGQIEVA